MHVYITFILCHNGSSIRKVIGTLQAALIVSPQVVW